MPVGPDNRGFSDGAGFGAIIINIEWFKDKFNFTGGFFKIVEDVVGVFGEVDGFVEFEFFGDVGAENFVNSGIHTAVNGE